MSLTVKEFVPRMSVTELLMKTLENAAKDMVSQCITECACRYGFDADEEIRRLGVENLSLIRKQMVRKGKSSKISVAKEKKSVCPMPFIAEKVDFASCHGLSYNRGLFTQCDRKVSNADGKNPGRFCKKCLEEVDQSVTGDPVCGSIQSRLACGPYEFKDTKGRSPVLYSKVLEKLKISSEKVRELQQIINPVHFQEMPKMKRARKVKEPKEAKEGEKKKGRPKKASVAIETEQVSDLFAKLVAEDEQPVFEEVVVEEVKEVVEEVPLKSSPKSSKKSDEEKELKKALLEEERRIKKEEKEAKIAQEKAEKELKKAQEKAERELKLAQEKAEKEVKRQQEKAEREAKKAAEKAAKEAEKAAKSKKSEPVPAPAPEAKTTETTTMQGIRQEVNGKTYFRSIETNVMYDIQTKEEVGIYDEETNTMQPMPEEEDENEVDGEEDGEEEDGEEVEETYED